jgi:hypothetical protein
MAFLKICIMGDTKMSPLARTETRYGSAIIAVAVAVAVAITVTLHLIWFD